MEGHVDGLPPQLCPFLGINILWVDNVMSSILCVCVCVHVHVCNSSFFVCVCVCVCTGTDAVVLCENSTDSDGMGKCGEFGTCILEEGIETCLCDAGYNGTMCEEEFDRCLSRGCKNGGICTNSLTDFLECECPYGYDHNTQCLLPNFTLQLCKTDPPCQNNATCSYPVPIPFIGLPYICNCTQGWWWWIACYRITVLARRGLEE